MPPRAGHPFRVSLRHYLQGSSMPTDPLSVACPTCAAPPGAACTYGTHLRRIAVVAPPEPARSRDVYTPPEPPPPTLHPGRYAVEFRGRLRFYKVHRDGRISEQYGPRFALLPRREAAPVAAEIRKAPGAARIVYGALLGICGSCGTPLTNPTSRALGVGPVCGGRAWPFTDIPSPSPL